MISVLWWSQALNLMLTKPWPEITSRIQFIKKGFTHNNHFRFRGFEPECPDGCAYAKDGDPTDDIWCFAQGSYPATNLCPITPTNPFTTVPFQTTTTTTSTQQVLLPILFLPHLSLKLGRLYYWFLSIQKPDVPLPSSPRSDPMLHLGFLSFVVIKFRSHGK